MKKNIFKLLSISLTTSLLFVGCANDTKKNDVAQAAQAEDSLNIVTSFYPIYISTLNIVKDIPNVSVTNLTEAQTGCLHDYQLTPQDLTTLSDADTFIINGAGMEEFLDKVIDQYADMPIIDSSLGIELLSGSGSHNHVHDDTCTDEDHAHEDHIHDETCTDEDHAHEEHVHDETCTHDHSSNPHIWVSISNNITQVENITKELCEIDPANADIYKKNSVEYIAKLENLKTEMHSTLDGLSNKNIVTFHEAFPYFAEEFDLNIVDIIQNENGAEPTAKELEEVINIAKENNITALFTEPQYLSKTANTIANEINGTVYILDPVVTGDATPDAIDDYINKMKENLNVLKEALK